MKENTICKSCGLLYCGALYVPAYKMAKGFYGQAKYNVTKSKILKCVILIFSKRRGR